MKTMKGMDILVRNESETDAKFGRRPEERSVEQLVQYGVINVNKPAGPTSHQVADHVKKMVGVARAGHAGTLDPRVTGVLAVALAKATRVVGVLLKSPKEYTAWMHLHKEMSSEQVNEV